MTPYPDSYNPELLDRIPFHAVTVLDVGCGTGALLAAYRRNNPRARLLGIERDPDAARIASERLDAVAITDVQTNPTPFPGGIDCIIYGDVIEHLQDPWDVIAHQTELLTEDGVLLMCVPNVEHWSFAARLLGGTWDYEQSGLFDETHLRWFSLETMRKRLLSLGLSPCDVHPRIFEPQRAEAFVKAMTPGLEALGIDPVAYGRRASPLQYVWRVRRQPRRTIAIAGNMLKPVGGVSHLRVVHPLLALATEPTLATHLCAGSEVPKLDADIPKIYLLHRPILTGEVGLKALQALISAGWLVVTEFDDHPDYFPAMRVPELYTFSGVHAVQTSTPDLAEILQERNPAVAVFPNAVKTLPEVQNFRDGEPLTLFFGALNREKDWQPFLPVLNAVAETAGERLRFSIVHDREFFEGLTSPHKTFVPTCDYDRYLELLGSSEISFMPLADTTFNRCKSDLKFIEAGACRTVALASPIVYGATIEDGRTGLIFHTPEELHAHLTRLISMPRLALTIAEAARDYVAEERMLAYQTADRIAWYRSLWARRDELTRALLDRVPELTSPATMAATRASEPLARSEAG